ncbi:hypothetical protein, partial [Candidatus Magnetominusculus dajiuhuensis]|uniref:hypothetical protein n=1 Tax=Candidatus Magnetominusculus dajiuhuensis TaxID=3137712 RepID=UPI003B428D93
GQAGMTKIREAISNAIALVLRPPTGGRWNSKDKTWAKIRVKGGYPPSSLTLSRTRTEIYCRSFKTFCGSEFA